MKLTESKIFNVVSIVYVASYAKCTNNNIEMPLKKLCHRPYNQIQDPRLQGRAPGFRRGGVTG